MSKKWLLLGLFVFAGCAEKDPDEEARTEVERMASIKKGDKKREIAREDLRKVK